MIFSKKVVEITGHYELDRPHVCLKSSYQDLDYQEIRQQCQDKASTSRPQSPFKIFQEVCSE